MQRHMLRLADLQMFRDQLIQQEHSPLTVEKYYRDVLAFYQFLPSDKAVGKEQVIAYKRHLSEHYKGSSVNSMLVAVNVLLRRLGWDECRVRLLKLQRKSFRETERELTKTEYLRLLTVAKRSHNRRLYYLMQTICSTGIRVSEHRYITVEAIQEGVACVRNKGKERMIFIPAELKKPLLQFCKQRGIETGPVFVTNSGRPMDRSNIWAEMKKLCSEAHVERKKVFPHNLRHLFALTFYRLEKDIMRLADVLGHSSVETTRIYTTVSSVNQKRLLSRLGLVCSG